MLNATRVATREARVTVSTTTTTDVRTTAFAVEITATTPIDAPPERVWAVLADTQAYADWNPFVRALRGPLVEGERIEVELQLPGRKLQTFKPRVVSVEPGRSFAWLGHVGPTGVFDGRHSFTVEADGAGSRLVQAERLAGLLVPAFRRMLTGPTPAGFAAMNEALRDRVQRG